MLNNDRFRYYNGTYYYFNAIFAFRQPSNKPAEYRRKYVVSANKVLMLKELKKAAGKKGSFLPAAAIRSYIF
jgi:hypothetical protein